MKKLISIFVLALFWVANALYLTIAAFKQKTQWVEQLFCDVNDTFSCSNLFTHDFAWIFGIPFPLIALVVYPIIAIIAVLGYFGKIKNPFLPLLVLAIWGLMFNSYIIYNEFLVSVFCLACLACTFAIAIVWILSWIWVKNQK